MPTDPAPRWSAALHILTIATVVMGFGLFEATIPIERLFSPDKPVAFVAAWIKTYIFQYAIVAYGMTMWRVRRLCVQGDQSGRALVRKGPFDAMMVVTGLVIVIFIIEQIERAAGLL